jgi:hypothetical protein
MAAKQAKSTPRKTGAKRATKKLSPEARAAYGEIKQGIGHLEKSMREIQRGVRKAERKIEADARARVRELRAHARTQLGVLKAKRREAGNAVASLTTAAEVSWQEIKQTADAILADARGTAASIIDRLRTAISR